MGLLQQPVSPSAYTRSHERVIFYTLQYAAHLKKIWANVLHGCDTYIYEFSKAARSVSSASSPSGIHAPSSSITPRRRRPLRNG
jgi:hypothetical protein